MFAKLFLDHPRSVNESYFEHFLFAMRFSILLFWVAFATLVHAMLPFLFEKTAGELIKSLSQKMQERSGH